MTTLYLYGGAHNCRVYTMLQPTSPVTGSKFVLCKLKVLLKWTPTSLFFKHNAEVSYSSWIADTFIFLLLALFLVFSCFHSWGSISTICRSQWPCGLRHGAWPVGCWDRGFESGARHGCLSASFCVVLSCVGRGLATGCSLVQGVLPYVLISSRNLLYVRRSRSFKDCRATGKNLHNISVWTCYVCV
jgi:hypothetical protein